MSTVSKPTIGRQRSNQLSIDFAMSELSASSTSPPTLFDPVAIEARLNALAGMCNDDVDADQATDVPDLQEQFLADETLRYLGSRSTSPGLNDEEFHTVVEYHRIPVEPNQTRVILHLGFCPDFPLVPKVDVTLIDAVGRVRVTQKSHFGTRIEITLAKIDREREAARI